MRRIALAACFALAVTTIGARVEAQVTPQPKPTIARFRTILTSASPTTCTNIEAGPGYLVAIINTGPALTVYPQVYDEGGAPTCAAADLLFGDGTSATALQSGQVILFTMPTNAGISVKITGGALPATNNLIITRI